MRDRLTFVIPARETRGKIWYVEAILEGYSVQAADVSGRLPRTILSFSSIDHPAVRANPDLNRQVREPGLGHPVLKERLRLLTNRALRWRFLRALEAPAC